MADNTSGTSGTNVGGSGTTSSTSGQGTATGSGAPPAPKSGGRFAKAPAPAPATPEAAVEAERQRARVAELAEGDVDASAEPSAGSVQRQGAIVPDVDAHEGTPSAATRKQFDDEASGTGGPAVHNARGNNRARAHALEQERRMAAAREARARANVQPGE
jgi:hypothetical protein